ncbi:aldehyde dehydrogenase [Lysobacter arseniciresistens ZS79]|uniref:Aldehyde dehydrogenase n=1 Tax=Lysobacter arseniciresistens ZS79 TaxID=913325 RepID=A0A0A0F766_9GAMM|nr:aldehyde dehydrogenase family protein [Lysobacter arseniciresistens]KGM57217.1 aldehyde dehydrogenase [Lysobacter arseniciresistens ZS79]
MIAESPAATVERLRATFRDGRTWPLAWRRRQLQALRRMLVEREDEFTAALQRDLGKPALESFVTEIGFTIGEIDHALRHLRRWAAGARVAVPLALQPARARVEPQPLGVVLVIAPWNYPLQLLLAPLCGALAAGNCALLKPSEMAPATSRALAEWIPHYLDPGAVAVVEGDADTATALLEQRFDHVFFTGGARVARVVAAAAARHLTPVTLELGGKSPAIVHDGDLRAVARRIVHGKFLNAGQTCVAPDHVLVLEPLADELVRHLGAVLVEFFGPDPAASPDYGRIVDHRHFDRLVAALGDARVAIGGDHDRERLHIAPTVVVDPPADSPLLREEIFGPILPVLRVPDLAAAITQVNRDEPPLAAYVFTRSAGVREAVERGIRAGAIGVNVCAAHLAVPGLPFGGVGASGIGRYHGRHSFDTFSQLRPVFSKGTLLDTLRFAYPPYSRFKAALLRKLL